MFCTSLFVLFSFVLFFFWALRCLSYFGFGLPLWYLQTLLSYIIVRKTYYNCESVESFLVDLVTQTGRQRTGDRGNIVRPMVNIDNR